MKILFLITTGMNRPYGLRCGSIARELVRLGHDVTILALHPNWARAESRRYAYDGVEVRYIGQMHARKLGHSTPRMKPLELLRIVVESTLRMALEAVWTTADCVHLGKPQPINGLAALLAGQVRRRPLYLDCDDYEAGSNRFSAAWQRQIFAWWEDYLPTTVDGITVNTSFLAERVASLGAPRDRIIRAPNGVDLATFRPPPRPIVAALQHALNLEGRRVIAYAGTLSLQNHPVDLILEALPLLLAREPRTVLLIIGGGEDFDQLRAQAMRSGLNHAVRFIGHVPQPMLRALLSLAEVSIDPVHDDDVARARFPLKIVESFALGLPVVTGDVGDRRMLPGNGAAGELVQPGDVSALAKGIANLLASHANLQLKARAAEEQVQAYDWSIVARDFARIYR